MLKMLDYKEEVWTNISKLFDNGHGVPIKQLINNLELRCQELMEHMKRISSICKCYPEVRSLRDADRIAESKYNEFYYGVTIQINFRVSDELSPFSNLKPTVYSFYSFKLLKERIKRNSDMSVSEFCRSLDSGMNSLLENISIILSKYRKGILLMS